MLTKDVLSFEERIAACENHSGFRADIVVVYGKRLPVRGDFRPQSASSIGFVRNDVREAEQQSFTISLCGAGRHSEPVFAALPAQKALTTPN
ncbi:hypothetical protein [Rhizobium sp. AU243]|uniref:hypothetical protein n=1 Tax=Rhizobium sp. AU243 TaxID=2303425 RepID=UPI0014857204|nr:hypothetical protein [Rhizobium sp. AU243]